MISDCRLVLLRHGESAWNRDNLFTGWRDVRLSERGRDEARVAGRLLRESGFAFDIAFTSVLSRAIETLWIALDEMDRMWIPVEKSWRLNERHYGALQGRNKIQAVEEYGESQVKQWRRGYAVRPPLETSAGSLAGDPRYAGMAASDLPRGESLKDVLERVLPYWNAAIAPRLREGKQVLIVAHGNSLRALMKRLEKIGDEEIVSVDLPTGIPRSYRLGGSLETLEAAFLGDPAEIGERIQSVQRQTARA